jgi:hypothetical protein
MPAKKRKTKKRVKPRTKAAKFTKASLKRKFNLAFRRFVFFVILFVACLVLYSVTSSGFLLSLFGMLSIIFGVISLGLMITLLVLFFSKK